MTLITIKRTGVDLLETMVKANAIGFATIVVAMEQSGRNMEKQAKIFAPVYESAKYPSWAHMPHAHRTGGRLKRSIKTKHTTFKHSGRVKIRAGAYYASYIENGFRHRIAGRWIYGRTYMRSAYNTAFIVSAQRKLAKAFDRTFEGVPHKGV